VGLLRLLQDDLASGWPLWENRLEVPSFGHPKVALPRWRGESAAGRRLLVLAEQGFGDILQFARFLPWVARQSRAAVTFGVPRALFRLLQPFGAAHGSDVVTGRVEPEKFELLAWVCSLAGLPGAAAAEPPYLAAAAEATAAWRRRRPARRLCVGLCWEGKPDHPQDASRSLDPAMLLPLAAMPGVVLIGMKRPPVQRQPPDRLLEMDWGPDVGDFADSAAMLVALDLLVTVDTALAHLAGALGVPALVLLPWVPDWRWGLEGEASGWYPSLRLFRQASLGDWAGVVEAVRRELGRAEEVRRAAATALPAGPS
jgi:hypothetical protein